MTTHSATAVISAFAAVCELHQAEASYEVELRRYSSLMQLAASLRELDTPACGSRLTVLLVLDQTFSGDLCSVVQRRNLGFRLTLTSLSRAFYLPVSSGDLAMKSRALGWQQIVVERNAATACEGTLRSMQAHEQLVIFWPQWRDATVVEAQLRNDGLPPHDTNLGQFGGP